MRDVVATSSPSMDIQISSNFERYLFDASDRDAELVARQMQMLAQGRRFELTEKQRDAVRGDFGAGAADEVAVASTIRETRAASGYLLDPHTACGVFAANAALEGHVSGEVARVVLATAHPAKFPDAMEAITGARPGLPPRLSSLMTDAERYPVLTNDLKEVEGFVESVARAAVGGNL
jgi:threonine synthase